MHPNAKHFMHCHNHALNLVILSSCNSVPLFQNLMDMLKELTLFFKYSAKFKHILHDHLKSSDQEDFLADCVNGDLVLAKRRCQELPVLSDTHWFIQVDSIDCLLKHYRAVGEALEAVRNSSSSQSATDADSFLRRPLSLEFLVSAVICHHVLEGLSQLLSW